MSVRKSKSPGVPVSGQSSGSPIPYTPAITWPGNTIGAVIAQYVRQPGVLSIWGTFVESAGTANATLTIPLPTGFTASIACCVGSVSVNAGASSLSVSAGGTSAINTFIVGSVTTWGFTMTVPVNG